MRALYPALVVPFALACSPAERSNVHDAPRTLLNVSFDATREFYRAYDSLFVHEQRTPAGDSITIEQSHGGSATQAHSVIDGLRADVVTLATPGDIDAIAASGLLDSAWATKLPHASSPLATTIVFLVRAGNPKAIHDWPDLIRPGITVITANPKTSGGGRWAYLAAWGTALARTKSDSGAHAYVAQLFAHVPTLDPSARAATTSFVEHGLGDVLLAWESDALLATHTLAPGKVDIVRPSLSIAATLPVAVVDQNVDAHGTRAVAESYLRGLYSPDAQALAARAFYRPTDTAVAARYATQFPALPRFTVDSVFHSWRDAQRTHFADGGVFDQIQAAVASGSHR